MYINVLTYVWYPIFQEKLMNLKNLFCSNGFYYYKLFYNDY